MSIYSGAAVRALVDALPAHVFDAVVDELPELFDSLKESQVYDFIHWEETGPDHTPNDVAQDYGLEDYDELLYDSVYYVLSFDDGLLLIE